MRISDWSSDVCSSGLGGRQYRLLPASQSMDILIQQLINGITVGSVYALVALGYTMVYGIIGLINFAHGDVVMVGAMVATTLVAAFLGADPGTTSAWTIGRAACGARMCAYVLNT